MKTWKNISILLLLIALTCGVVFVPQTISGQKQKNALNQVIRRTYSAGSRPKLTSEQVARLYYNREISIGYNSLSVDNEDNQAIQANFTDFIELLFGEDETVYHSLKEIFMHEKTRYFRNSSLIKIHNRPTALNFVTCYGKEKDGEILYEEKTKTLIRASFLPFKKTFENAEEKELYAAKIASMIGSYFENQLHFSKDEYFFSVDIPAVAEGKNGYLAYFYITCGLLQHENKKMELKMENYN